MLGYVKKVLLELQRPLKLYWSLYGGMAAIRKSPFFLIAFLFGIITIAISDKATVEWSSVAINIFPDVLGFTLGGYAMMVGFGDREFLRALRGPNKDGSPSPYMKVNGMFVHFIIVQFVTLIFATFIELAGFENKVLTFLFALIGITLMCYALLTVVGTAWAVMDFANWYDRQHDPSNDADSDNG